MPSSKPKRLASAQVRRCGKLLYRVGVFLRRVPQEREIRLEFETGGDYRTSRFRILMGSGGFYELLSAMMAVNRSATMGAVLSVLEDELRRTPMSDLMREALDEHGNLLLLGHMLGGKGRGCS